MTRKYVGVDLHTSTTSQMAVRDEDGELLFEPISVQTKPEALVTAVKAVDGEVEILVEAGTGSGWFKDLLEPHVKRVIVCHAADNVRNRGNKTDKLDAADLAKRLWSGDYTAVYQGEEVRGKLRELVNRYLRAVRKVVRAKNQLKAIFRGRNIVCRGSEIYKAEHREKWLAKLEEAYLRESARHQYEAIDLFEGHKEETQGRMIQTAKQHDGWESVSSLPGFGDIRTSKAIGIIGTPWRFPGKRQLWRYSCLAVVVHDSRQWHTDGPNGVVRHHEQITRGLNQDGRPELKNIFRSAADSAIQNYPEVKEDFEARCRQKSPDKAKLDISRKLASQLLTVWKRKEVYRADKARWKEISSEG